jgi:HSP20 family protein
MNLVTFNPERALDQLFDTDRFFGFPRENGEQAVVLPKVNVIEKEDAFHLEAETPGMTEKDISVEFHAGVLTLKGHREQNCEMEKNDYRIHEFSQQSFARSFRLSDQIDPEKIVARMDLGVLKVALPKKEQAKPKKIEMKVEP